MLKENIHQEVRSEVGMKEDSSWNNKAVNLKTNHDMLTLCFIQVR